MRPTMPWKIIDPFMNSPLSGRQNVHDYVPPGAELLTSQTGEQLTDQLNEDLTDQ